MRGNRIFFVEYLRGLDLYTEGIEVAFDKYFSELLRVNQVVNLFSRKMSSEDVWTKHFMDSVSVFEVYRDWSGKKVLDFGTGGGLPGIPIKIVAPECEMTLLDSTKKKIEAIKSIMGNDKLSYLSCRLEDQEMDAYVNYFDIIVCRSVKVTPILQRAMSKVLKRTGKIFLYKATSFEDAKLFKNHTVHKLDLEILGERRIVEVNYG